MAGRSYGGAAQWLAAAEQPPHLKALFPVAIGSDFYDGWIYQGGAFQLGFNLFWALLDRGAEGGRAGRDPQPAPSAAHGTRLAGSSEDRASFYFDWLDHSTDDAFWQRCAINRHYDRVLVPAYNVGGWYDVFLGGTLENFARMRRRGRSAAAARRGQKLLVGPWGHGSTYGPYPDHSFPAFAPDDALDLAEVQLRFFARYLKGERNGIDEEPPVRIFVMGENRWRDEEDWPLARARATPWYLRAPAGDGGDRGPLPGRSRGTRRPTRTSTTPTTPRPPWAGPRRCPPCSSGTAPARTTSGGSRSGRTSSPTPQRRWSGRWR